MSTLVEIRAAVAAGRFSGNEGAILAGALLLIEPWTGAYLIRRMPERDRTGIYKSLRLLLSRKVLLKTAKDHRQINPRVGEWMNSAGNRKLFADGTPEQLGYLRRMTDAEAPTKLPRKPTKKARVKSANVEQRSGIDNNGDLPGQRHLADLDKKEPDPWNSLTERLKRAHREQ